MFEGLRGSRVAFLLAAENLTESEVLDSICTLESNGAQVDLIGARSCDVQVLRRTNQGVTTKVSLRADRALNQITLAEYQVAALPAALGDNGSLATDADVLQFLRDMQAHGKPFICFSESAPPQGNRSSIFRLKLADSWQNWNAIDAPRLGAALAYYTLLSLAPLVILMVAIAGLVFPRTIVESSLILPIRELMGNEVARMVNGVFENAKGATGVFAGALSILMLLVGASGVFLELRDSLDTVWGVKPRYGGGVLNLVRERAFAFLVIIGTGLVLLGFLLLGAILAAPARFVLRALPTEHFATQISVIAISFIVMTFIFALIYKVIPDTVIRWSDVWIGAVITSILFTSGRLLISLYLGRASIGSPYAAAGSIVVFLTWVYYSAQIFLLGAEFTHVYALRHGSYARTPQRKANHKVSPGPDPPHSKLA